MRFPSNEKIKKMRALLEQAEPSRILEKNATTAERVKYKICEKFAAYILDTGITQAELARKLNMDPARLNDIIKYRIELFTIDKLIDFAERLDSQFKIEVA